MIIGISGKIGSGKDTVAKIIQYLVFLNSTKEADRKFFYLKGEDVVNADPIMFQEGSPWKIKKFAGKLKQIVSLLTGISVEDLEKQEVKDSELGKEWKYVLHYEDYHVEVKDVDYFKGDEVFESNPSRFIKGYTVRKLLQTVGTEAMREQIHPNVWVNALFADYEECCGDQTDCGYGDGFNCTFSSPNWIVTDVRFPNEANAIKERGGILIRLERYPKTLQRAKGGWTGETPPEGAVEEIPFDSNNKAHMDLLAGQSQREHPSENSLDGYTGFNYIIANDGTIDFLVNVVKEILIKEKII